MKDSIQIVLFFENNTYYNPSKIASLINEKIKEIGTPVILPINNGAPAEANIPIILFNQNNKVNIVTNFHSVTITLFEEMIDNAENIIKTLIGIYSENKFIRIGIIIQNVLENSIYTQIKEETNCNDNIINANDFKLAWLTELEINNVKINMWKNYFTDKSKSDKVLRVMDFNTKIDEKIFIDKKFASQFLKECKKYL